MCIRDSPPSLSYAIPATHVPYAPTQLLLRSYGMVLCLRKALLNAATQLLQDARYSRLVWAYASRTETRGTDLRKRYYQEGGARGDAA
eukprot:2124477-Rhodomonas_salina.2